MAGSISSKKSFGEIGEVFKDPRNGVHPGLNWENDDPQHSAPTNSSEFHKPELGRAILMEASGLKFTPPPHKIPPRMFFKEDSKGWIFSLFVSFVTVFLSFI